jgi:hypothetical protein
MSRVLDAIQYCIYPYQGFCIECGAQADGVEPDAEGYECVSCQAEAVYGAEQLLFYIVE